MSTDLSLEHQVALLSTEEQEAVLADLDMETLEYDWNWTGRPSQIFPVGTDQDPQLILALAGRGWGKTRAGAQWMRTLDEQWHNLGRDSGHMRFALLGRTSADVRDVMLEGPSGLLNIYPPSMRDRIVWTPSRRRLEMPNGSVGIAFSAEEPDQLRGPQFHCFPAGTLVRTADGPVPIEQIRQGTQVWTRYGLREVTVSQSRMAEVATLHHAKGSLTGTLDHPVLTQRGWVDLALIGPTDTIVGWMSESGRSTTEDEPGEKRVRAAGSASGEATTTGKPSTDQSPLGTKSIISTLIDSMTSPATWSPSLMKTMSLSTERPWSQGPVNDVRKSSTSLLSEVIANTATLAEKPYVVRRSEKLTPIGLSDILRLADTAEPSSSPAVEPIAVKGVSISGHVTPVYNLTVEGQAEYFADNILVHNCGWSDETASYKQIRAGSDNATAWENLRIAVRLGTLPQILSTTTPKRVPLLKQILAEAKDHPEKVLIRRGKTMDNVKLSSGYMETLLGLYGGTQLGKQELDGEMLDDVVGAMTSEAVIEAYRVTGVPIGIPWIKIVGVDPSVAEKPHDECGIVVVYISNTYPVHRRHAFVVDDLSQRASPTVWGDIVVKAAHEHDALIVAETNQGAALVKQMVRQSAFAANLPMPRVREVWSSKSKAVRSEPVSGAYNRGRVHHVNVLAELEDQISTWVPGESGYSPDRMDALVHACASGLFPEALIHGAPGTTTLHSVAKQRIPLTLQTNLPARRSVR